MIAIWRLVGIALMTLGFTLAWLVDWKTAVGVWLMVVGFYLGAGPREGER